MANLKTNCKQILVPVSLLCVLLIVSHMRLILYVEEQNRIDVGVFTGPFNTVIVSFSNMRYMESPAE